MQSLEVTSKNLTKNDVLLRKKKERCGPLSEFPKEKKAGSNTYICNEK